MIDLSRRRFLRRGAATAAALTLPACATPDEELLRSFDGMDHQELAGLRSQRLPPGEVRTSTIARRTHCAVAGIASRSS